VSRAGGSGPVFGLEPASKGHSKPTAPGTSYVITQVTPTPKAARRHRRLFGSWLPRRFRRICPGWQHSVLNDCFESVGRGADAFGAQRESTSPKVPSQRPAHWRRTINRSSLRPEFAGLESSSTPTTASKPTASPSSRHHVGGRKSGPSPSRRQTTRCISMGTHGAHQRMTIA
jgi:hypothetical protein